jgi:hypothetical protein
VGGTIFVIPVTALPVKVSYYIRGAWKISNPGDGKNNDFAPGPPFFGQLLRRTFKI